ncbi:RHS repeat-associated core domain-containing protein, partial [Streptomyces sp. SID3343]|uniref:RHS repeat-associated core domain-containing protein n=1 Tax=Streptomyces sp. SID3343 TaxID=2690260 RepID=UPI00136F9E37
PNPLRYTSTYLDPTGLYKTGARYYDPSVGRFTQTDPAGKEANGYAYAAGDPINRADPTGTWSLKSAASKATKRLGRLNQVATAWQFGEKVAAGDWKGAAGVGADFVAGGLVETGCTYITGGTGAVPCAVLGTYVGKQVGDAVENA